MHKQLLLFLISFCAYFSVQGTALLDDLNFDEGEWVMIGVSLHNYHLLPVQKELGTFMLDNPIALKQIQAEWNYEEVYEDYCDYHYALKFYKDGELVRTLRANLLCNYITLNGLSYKFTEADMLKFKNWFQDEKWSRIRFKDLDLLKVAVQTLDDLPKVYWYGDTKQYNFDGSFITLMKNQKWNANRDSLEGVMSDKISQMLRGRDDFYLDTYYWLLSDDFETMSIRFKVYCDQSLFNDYQKKVGKSGNDIVIRWRNHFSEQSFVQLVVVGLNKQDYFRAMGQN